ncbi:SET domain-containing protein [Streptomyces sp. NPDC058401]|uniref:SET domain-containing protein n=1 Tax=Streptomyces sp. NPDC058401 TaxID=3346480 RepID=UPI0036508479
MLTSGIDIHASSTHNVGLFATEPIPAGTAVWLPCPKCSTWSGAELAAIPSERYGPLDKYGHMLVDGAMLLPCLGAFLMNHSCEANVLDLGLDFGVAVKDIAVGEEVTCDYATFTEDPGWRMQCHCPSTACRGEITTEQGHDPGVRETWRTRIEPVLPLMALVPQPLHDVLDEVSVPYARILRGASGLDEVATGANVCAPSFRAL